MRLLISAYSCETGRGSEAEIGWRIVHELAKVHDVRVITRANLRELHERSFEKAPKPDRLSFEYFDLPWMFRFYKKGKRFFLVYYYLWQIGVAFRARRMLREEPADVLHHLIGGMDWMPAGLAFCPGFFVWGPIGSEDTHPGIRKHLPLQSKLRDYMRTLVRNLMRNIDPFTRLTGARASVILSHTPENLPRRYATKKQVFTQTGIVDRPEMSRPKTVFDRDGPLQLLFAGELKDWKGAQLALDATLRFLETGAEARLTVIGDGPLRSQLQRTARLHQHGHRVTFAGQVPMAGLVEALHRCDVFLYPSFHHGLATVVLQAMLTGVPVVCIEGDATGRTVGQEAGITVKPTADRSPINDLAKAIAELADDEVKRVKLAHRARALALERYSYEALGKSLSKIYEAYQSTYPQ